MKTLYLNAYHYEELAEKAQNKALNDFIKFLIEATSYDEASSQFKKAIDKSEEMQTPWFLGEYLLEYAKAEIMAGLEDYLFLDDGSITPCQAKPQNEITTLKDKLRRRNMQIKDLQTKLETVKEIYQSYVNSPVTNPLDPDQTLEEINKIA